MYSLASCGVNTETPPAGGLAGSRGTPYTLHAPMWFACPMLLFNYFIFERSLIIQKSIVLGDIMNHKCIHNIFFFSICSKPQIDLINAPLAFYIACCNISMGEGAAAGRWPLAATETLAPRKHYIKACQNF